MAAAAIFIDCGNYFYWLPQLPEMGAAMKYDSCGGRKGR